MKRFLFALFLLVEPASLAAGQNAGADGPEGSSVPPGRIDSSATGVSMAAPVRMPVAIDPNYLLQVDDMIEVMVFREPDLTTDAMIRKDGAFDMKLLGAVRISNLTIDQATEVLRAALAKDYLVNPRVNLTILAYAKKKINILGEVRSPGLYTFPEHGTLMLSDAIAMAGGFLASADSAHVVVRRSVDDHAATLQVNASSSQNGTTDKFEMKPDDAVTVSILPKRHFTVLGQINRPGTYDVADGRDVYLTDAIALAGGFTRIANPSKVMLKRTEAGHEVVMQLDAKAMANSAATERM